MALLAGETKQVDADLCETHKMDETALYWFCNKLHPYQQRMRNKRNAINSLSGKFSRFENKDLQYLDSPVMEQYI